MNGVDHNPNASLLAEGGGRIVAMSGGGNSNNVESNPFLALNPPPPSSRPFYRTLWNSIPSPPLPPPTPKGLLAQRPSNFMLTRGAPTSAAGSAATTAARAAAGSAITAAGAPTAARASGAPTATAPGTPGTPVPAQQFGINATGSDNRGKHIQWLLTGNEVTGNYDLSNLNTVEAKTQLLKNITTYLSKNTESVKITITNP